MPPERRWARVVTWIAERKTVQRLFEWLDRKLGGS